MLRKFGYRLVGVAATCIYLMGIVLCAYAPNIYFLFLSYGVIAGDVLHAYSISGEFFVNNSEFTVVRPLSQCVFIISILFLFPQGQACIHNRHSIHNNSGKSEIKYNFGHICFHYGIFYWCIYLANPVQKVTRFLHMERCIFTAREP